MCEVITDIREYGILLAILEVVWTGSVLCTLAGLVLGCFNFRVSIIRGLTIKLCYEDMQEPA